MLRLERRIAAHSDAHSGGAPSTVLRLSRRLVEEELAIAKFYDPA